jgi:hypothetical protein
LDTCRLTDWHSQADETSAGAQVVNPALVFLDGRSAIEVFIIYDITSDIELRTPPLLAHGTLYALLALIVVAIQWATFSDLDCIAPRMGASSRAHSRWSWRR